MANVHTLNELNNGAPLVSGNKLGDSPFNRYPSSRTELENQVFSLALEQSLDKKQGEFFRACMPERDCYKIGRDTSSPIGNKRVGNEVFLAQKDLSEMDSLRRELAQSRQNVELKNVDLDLKEDKLNDKKGELIRLRDELTSTRIELMDTKEELMQMRDNLSSVQKTLSEKEILLQETNTRLAVQIQKTSSESEVLGGVKGLENEIKVMHSQFDTQKNQKTGLPPMKLRLLDMDEVTKHESFLIQLSFKGLSHLNLIDKGSSDGLRISITTKCFLLPHKFFC
ncbi:73_t:CDS:2 [Acaulospora morrowiae]|uniref:73_t:CDS:1 n=1 Tax=Acaulospora morrowiae TaxID=94023 RepID=A0A9N9D4L1_9GLOM|nr:73_t:CDS:2 [Acaulospora morrowiae]